MDAPSSNTARIAWEYRAGFEPISLIRNGTVASWQQFALEAASESGIPAGEQVLSVEVEGVPRAKSSRCVRVVKCSSVTVGGYGIAALCFATVVVLDPKALYAQRHALLVLPILVAGLGMVTVGVTTWGARRCYLGSKVPEGTCLSIQRQRIIKATLVLLAGYGIGALCVATVVVLDPKALYQQERSLILIPTLVAALGAAAVAISTWGARRCYRRKEEGSSADRAREDGFLLTGAEGELM